MAEAPSSELRRHLAARRKRHARVGRRVRAVHRRTARLVLRRPGRVAAADDRAVSATAQFRAVSVADRFRPGAHRRLLRQHGRLEHDRDAGQRPRRRHASNDLSRSRALVRDGERRAATVVVRRRHRRGPLDLRRRRRQGPLGRRRSTTTSRTSPTPASCRWRTCCAPRRTTRCMAASGTGITRKRGRSFITLMFGNGGADAEQAGRVLPRARRRRISTRPSTRHSASRTTSSRAICAAISSGAGTAMRRSSCAIEAAR